MKISFIVPVYNAERYLARCIKSVLSLESNEIELILVDDGSTDASGSLCAEFARDDSRIKVITQKNAGVSSARNSGIANADGEYCFFLDADDFLIEENAKALLQEAESGKDIICFNHVCLYENGHKIEECYSYNGEDPESIYSIKKQLLSTHMLHTCWGKLFKKDIIDRYGTQFPVGVRVGEDYLFVLDFCKHISSGKLINIPVLYYYINATSVMQNYREDERLHTWLKLMRYTEKYYLECGYNFDHEFYLYQFRTFTSMTRSVFLTSSKEEIAEYMMSIQNEKEVAHIVEKVDSSKLGLMKAIELQLTKGKRWFLFRLYFTAKAYIERIRTEV